jgi:hypothetical protein
MNREEIVQKTQGKKAYDSPNLSVYGRVSQLTSSGSGDLREGSNGLLEEDKKGLNDKIVIWRP